RPSLLALEQRADAGVERFAGALGQVRLLASEVADLEPVEGVVLGVWTMQAVAEILDEVSGQHGRALEVVRGADREVLEQLLFGLAPAEQRSDRVDELRVRDHVLVRWIGVANEPERASEV